MTSSNPSKPSEVGKKFLDEYVNSLPEKFKAMQQHIERLEKSPDTESLSALRLLVHKMAGSAGTYGFLSVSILCRQFEEKIIEITASKNWDGVRAFRPYLKEIRSAFPQ